MIRSLRAVRMISVTQCNMLQSPAAHCKQKSVSLSDLGYKDHLYQYHRQLARQDRYQCLRKIPTQGRSLYYGGSARHIFSHGQLSRRRGGQGLKELMDAVYDVATIDFTFF